MSAEDVLQCQPDTQAEDLVTTDWPTLVPLDYPDLPSLERDSLPTWAGDYASALATATETPIELAMGMVMTACATAVARNCEVEVEPGYREPCNLWVLVALPSGSRKSAVQSEAIKPLLEWENQQAASLETEIHRAESERQTMEARVIEIRKKAAKSPSREEAEALAREAAEIELEMPIIPVPPRLWTTDCTPEKLGSLLAEHGECFAWLSSEAGIFDLLKGRYSNGIPNLDLILKAHSGDSDRVDRGSRSTVSLNYPRLTIGLSPQPDVLTGLAMNPGFRGRGLLARFLYFLPRSTLGYRTLNTTPVPADIRAAYEVNLHRMLNWQAMADNGENLQLLKLNESAADLLLDYARRIERMMRPGECLEYCTDFGGKLPGAATRIAAVLHCIIHAAAEPWSTPIERDTMEQAISLATIAQKHSLAAMGIMGADPTVASARYVWDWIERKRLSVFSERDAFNDLRGRFPQMENLRPALKVLEERGYIMITESAKKKRGRPSSPNVLVRPEIVDDWR